MATHKALVLDKKQGSFSVQYVRTPAPGPGEVRIRVLVAGLNPVDWKIRRNGIIVTDFPAVLGIDGAGEVVELGEGVGNHVQIGDRQYNNGNRRPTLQHFDVIPADIVAKIPWNVSTEAAASIPSALMTVVAGLFDVVDERKAGAGLVPGWRSEGRGAHVGEPALVVGGSSSVGQFAIQMFRMMGYTPIITTASLKHADFLKSLGATHVLDRSEELASALGSVDALKAPLKMVFDTISLPETQLTSWEAVAPGGTLLIVLFHTTELREREKSDPSKLIVKMVGGPYVPGIQGLGRELYANLTALLESGDIVANRVEVLPNGLLGVEDGLERLESGRVSGVKLIVRPQETG